MVSIKFPPAEKIFSENAFRAAVRKSSVNFSLDLIGFDRFGLLCLGWGGNDV